ncbi:MAG: hypothetical protein HUN05_23425 [Desulfobacter sp.]|nr:MAG: hypothetical protein HUN05_23425 [Desulfobacter sp.]
MKPILVVADLVESRDQKAEIRPVIQEVLAWAEQIQDLLQEPADSKEVLPEIQILVPAHLPLTAAEKLAEQTGIKTIALSFPDRVTPESLKQGLAHIADQIRPCWILFAHTTMGREVAPGLAARLNASAISGATGVGADPAGLFFFRPVMDNGRIQKVRPCNAALGVLTLVPGAMAAKSRTLNIQGNLDPQDALAREGPLETPGKEALSRKNKFFCPVVAPDLPVSNREKKIRDPAQSRKPGP